MKILIVLAIILLTIGLSGFADMTYVSCLNHPSHPNHPNEPYPDSYGMGREKCIMPHIKAVTDEG